MSGSQEQDSEKFSEARKRFNLLEEKRQHQSAQIHKNMYLSLIIIAGIIGIFAQNENSLIQFLASMIAAATFGGLGIWTYLYDRSRNQVKNEKRKIYDKYFDKEFFEFTEEMHEIDEMYTHWKNYILYLFYVTLTIFSTTLSLWFLFSVFTG